MKIHLFNDNFLYIELTNNNIYYSSYNLLVNEFFDSFSYSFSYFDYRNKEIIVPITYDYKLNYNEFCGRYFTYSENIYLGIIKNYLSGSYNCFGNLCINNDKLTFKICESILKNTLTPLSKVPQNFRSLEICKIGVKKEHIYLSSVPKKIRNNSEIINIYLQSFINYSEKKYSLSKETISKLKNLSI